MKKKAEQHMAEDKLGSLVYFSSLNFFFYMETLKTGGGIFVPKITPIDEKILELIKGKYFFIENKIDSNQNDTTTEITTDNYDKINNENHIILVNEDCDKSIEQSSNETNDDLLPNKNIIKKSQDHLVNNININIDDINGDIDDNVNNEGQKRGQKRKLKLLKPKENAANLMIIKKIELINKKICVLDIIKKTEEENLKGKILDNEIKKIIKEKELIEFRTKQIQHPNVTHKL